MCACVCAIPWRIFIVVLANENTTPKMSICSYLKVRMHELLTNKYIDNNQIFCVVLLRISSKRIRQGITWQRMLAFSYKPLVREKKRDSCLGFPRLTRKFTLARGSRKPTGYEGKIADLSTGKGSEKQKNIIQQNILELLFFFSFCVCTAKCTDPEFQLSQQYW